MDFCTGKELVKLCHEVSVPISDIMKQREIDNTHLSADDVDRKLETVLNIMKKSAHKPIETPVKSIGGLIGGEAQKISVHAISNETICGTLLSKAIAYSMGVLEVNASMGLIVAAPTAGSAGVLPGVLLALQEEKGLSDKTLYHGLLNASAIGYLLMRNASVAGAEAGCQAEIGTACAMTAAATAYLFGLNLDDIEQAAEVALEHHLGLTCDPIDGYVQIPCIERNAVCALRALDSAKLVQFMGDSEHKISFDMVCKTMLETGRDLHEKYRETAEGGLAKEYRK